jgi:hypothetical protein
VLHPATLELGRVHHDEHVGVVHLVEEAQVREVLRLMDRGDLHA